MALTVAVPIIVRLIQYFSFNQVIFYYVCEDLNIFVCWTFANILILD